MSGNITSASGLKIYEIGGLETLFNLAIKTDPAEFHKCIRTSFEVLEINATYILY